MTQRAHIVVRTEAAVPQGATLIVGYPSGTSATTWLGGAHEALVSQSVRVEGVDFRLAFLADFIVFEWIAAPAIPAGATIRLVLGAMPPTGEVVSLLDFGVTGDGSATDGARIRRAIESAATDKLALTIPAAPSAEGWKIAADDDWQIESKSDFALIGEPGAVLGKLTGDFRHLQLVNCSNARLENVSLYGPNSGGGGIDLIGCSDITFRRMRNYQGRGFRLFDGTTRLTIDDVQWENATGSGVQFGEAGTHPSDDPISDIIVRNSRWIGARQEGLEFQNKPQRILIDRCQFWDCGWVGLEEPIDLGGGETEDITLRDIEIDNTGTKSAYSAAILRGILVKVEYGIRPKRIRIIRPRIAFSSADAESYGISCEADDYQIVGGSIEGDIAYGLSLSGGGIGSVNGTRIVGTRTYGTRIRNSARATMRGVYVAPASGLCVVADGTAWGDVEGEFIGGTYGVRFAGAGASGRASGIFRNQTIAGFDAVSTAAGAQLVGARMEGCEVAATLRGDRQQIVGLNAAGTTTNGVQVISGATNCSVVAATVTGYTNNYTDNGTGTVTAGNVTT
jgi:hypothetical protein